MRALSTNHKDNVAESFQPLGRNDGMKEYRSFRTGHGLEPVKTKPTRWRKAKAACLVLSIEKTQSMCRTFDFYW